MRQIRSMLALVVVAGFGVVPAAAGAAAESAAGRSWEVVTGLYTPLSGGEWLGDQGALGFVTVDTGSVRQMPLPDYYALQLRYSPDAQTLYSVGNFVIDHGGSYEHVSGFAAFDAASGETLWQSTDVSGSSLAVSPDGSALMLERGRFDVATQAFEPLDACTGDPRLPVAVAFAPDGGTVWLLCRGIPLNPVSELRAFDAVTLDPVTTIPLTDHYASALVLTLDGSTAVVSGDVGRTPSAPGAPGAPGVPAVTRVDLATGELADVRMDPGASLSGLAMAPDGAHVYVLAETEDVTAELTAVDITSMTVTASAPFPDDFGYLAVTPDGSRVYSATWRAPDGFETPLVGAHDAGTLATLSQSPFEASQMRGLAVTPDQAPVARLSASVPNSPVTFDASGSTVEFGSIAEYAWDFGDGTTLVTSTPVAEHEYAQPGVYAASVRLTSSGGTSTEDVYTGQQLLRNGDASAVATVTVTVPEQGELPELPPTGFDGVWLIAVAAGLLGAGLVVLVVTRRRART